MSKKILLLGEFCEDKFIYGRCDRLNPEAPTPVFTPTHNEYNLGMAGNAYKNLVHLDFKVAYPFECDKYSIRKTRYVDEVSNYILLRMDTGEENVKPIELDRIHQLSIGDFDAVVVSDYNKGLLTKDFLERVFMFAKGNEVPTFMDTKKDIGDWAGDCTFIKINEKEFKNPAHHDLLSSSMFKESLIVTLGSRGSYWNGKETATNEVGVRDVVGAGDTYLAGLVYGYLQNNEIENGIMIANKLASDVVSQKGVALPNKKLLI